MILEIFKIRNLYDSLITKKVIFVIELFIIPSIKEII
jgi:hypothetical protein